MPPQSRGDLLTSSVNFKSTPNLSIHNRLGSVDVTNIDQQSNNDSNRGRQKEVLITKEIDSSSKHEAVYSSDSASITSDSSDEIHLKPRHDRQRRGSDFEYTNKTLPHSQSTSYLTGMRSSTTFAPPFYNRPPTPLPPSPSLTSILRPINFSTSTLTSYSTPAAALLSYSTPAALRSFSQPSTPNHSSDEETNHNSNNSNKNTVKSPEHTRPPYFRSQSYTSQTQPKQSQAAAVSTLTTSFRIAPAGGIPLASPRVPTYEYYGFTLYLASCGAFIFFCLWSFLPTPFLHRLGVFYYPNRWWALAVPSWLVVATVWIYVALAGWNVEVLTEKVGGVGAVVDGVGMVAEYNSKNEPVNMKDWSEVWNQGTDAVLDIPLGGVCEVLYGHGNDDVDEND